MDLQANEVELSSPPRPAREMHVGPKRGSDSDTGFFAGRLFGASKQRARRVKRDIVDATTPPLSSPSLSSSETEPLTPRSDPPLTPSTGMSSVPVAEVIEWPLPPYRDAEGLGFDFTKPDGSTASQLRTWMYSNASSSTVSLAPDTYYDVPTWDADEHPGQRSATVPHRSSSLTTTSSLGMTLPSQSLIDLSRPNTLEELSSLRRAARTLEHELRRSNSQTTPVTSSKRIRRKAVPANIQELDESADDLVESPTIHRLSVASPLLDSPPPSIPAVLHRDLHAKRPSTSFYNTSLATQSVIDFSTRMGGRQIRSMFSKPKPVISSPIPDISDTDSHSEHSGDSHPSTDSSFSATSAKILSPRGFQNPSTPRRRSFLPRRNAPPPPSAIHIESRFSEYSDDSPRISTAMTAHSMSSSGSDSFTPLTPPAHSQTPTFVAEIETGLRRLGAGFGKGMTSVLNLGATLENDQVTNREGNHKKFTLPAFRRKSREVHRRTISVSKIFGRSSDE